MSPNRALQVLTLVAALGGCDGGTSLLSNAVTTEFTADYRYGNGCALHGDGSLLCRGDNTYGALGIGEATDGAYLPTNDVPVDADRRFTAVVAGQEHRCALDGDGAAWCWGRNAEGQLGVGDTLGPEACATTVDYYPVVIKGTRPCATRPVRVETSLRFRSLHAGDNETCGLTSGGELWCWGYAEEGFGLGGAALPAGCIDYLCPFPVRAAPGLTFRQFDLTFYGACGVATDRQAYCWGLYEWSGRFGRDSGSTADLTQPTPINSTAQFRAVDLGVYHACALTMAGALLCFGSNYGGELGDGTTISRTTPLPVDAPSAFVSVVTRGDGTCALDAAGKAWCWGANQNGELGLGHLLPALVPSPVIGGLTFQEFLVGDPTCAKRSDGIWCWGQLPSRFEQ